MGYTNYWRMGSSKKEFSPAIIGKVKRICKTYQEVYGEKLVGGFFKRNEEPIVNKKQIQFNVPSDETGEDFYINLDHRIDSNFCKTCREKYDAAVKAVIMVLQSAGYITQWKFDASILTDEEEFKEAVKLLEKTGMKYTSKMMPR